MMEYGDNSPGVIKVSSSFNFPSNSSLGVGFNVGSSLLFPNNEPPTQYHRN